MISSRTDRIKPPILEQQAAQPRTGVTVQPGPPDWLIQKLIKLSIVVIGERGIHFYREPAHLTPPEHQLSRAVAEIVDGKKIQKFCKECGHENDPKSRFELWQSWQGFINLGFVIGLKQDLEILSAKLSVATVFAEARITGCTSKASESLIVYPWPKTEV